MDRRTEISDHFKHVGAGTGLVLAWLGLIPGVIPGLALTAVVAAVLVLPLLVLGVGAAILAAPPYAAWRLVGWARRRRRRRWSERVEEPLPVPAPFTGVC